MKRLVVLSVLALASCASSQEITMPDGRSGYIVTCNRNYQSLADCRNEARRICAGNYEEVTKKSTYLEIVCSS